MSLPNKQYWQNRYLTVKARQLKNTAEYERALQPELNGLYRELHGELDTYYTRYANNEGISKEEAQKILSGISTKHWQMTLDEFEAKAKAGGHDQELNSEYYRSRIARLQALEQQLRQHTATFAGSRTEQMRTALQDQYTDSYMRTLYNLQVETASINGNFARFSPEQLRMVVSRPWAKDGKDFSQRIWRNYRDEMPSQLMDSILRGSLLGYSHQRIERMFHARFNDIKRKDIHRLIITEMSHVQEEATFKGYEEQGLEKYEYMATLETHTCHICAQLDGKEFPVKKRIPGENYPPIHPHCRCTTVPVVDDIPKSDERWSRDPETGKAKPIKQMTFDEWQKMVNGEKPTKQGSINLDDILNVDTRDKLNKLTPNGAQMFIDHLAQAPEEMQRLYYDNRDKFVIDSVDRKGGSYYSLGRIHFNPNDIESADHPSRNNIDTVFHEFAHAIDFDPTRRMEYVSKRYLKTGIKEYPIEKTYQASGQTKYDLAASLRAEARQVTDGLYEKYGDLFTKANWKKEAIRGDSTNWHQYSDVSDMIEGSTPEHLNLGFGHGPGYWSSRVTKSLKGTNGMTEAEFFAECTSATVNNPRSLAQIKEWFPESYKIYEQIVKDINEENSHAK
ncbi:minor capsid protein [Lentilactobacillus sp. Marseille-Q4993]|uniref:minor capsid protein n=1 Tax=Lentilactobacillus sp. Marseille-Q4993 TaxID=3039492 RepID=UPI0024BCC5ED|nr:minor capsid protein [Lentilactobacillus sp. Marseille-Q4993]